MIRIVGGYSVAGLLKTVNAHLVVRIVGGYSVVGLLKTVNAHLVVRLVGEILKVFFKTVQVHAHLVVELVGEILEVFFKTVHAHLVVRLVGGDFVAGLLNVEDQSLSLEVLNPKIKPTIGKIKVILRILILTQSYPDHLSRITLKLIFSRIQGTTIS